MTRRTAGWDAPPLVRLAAEGGATLSGLRLGDGAPMLHIERPGRSVQARLPGGAAFPEDGGLYLVREVARIEDVWLGAMVPGGGRGGRGRCAGAGAGDRGRRAHAAAVRGAAPEHRIGFELRTRW